MLGDAKMNIPASEVAPADDLATLWQGVVAGSQVSRPADQIEQVWGDGVQHLSGCHARRQWFFWRKSWQGRLPARRQLPFDVQIPLLRQIRVDGAVIHQQFFPFLLLSPPKWADFSKIGDVFRGKKKPRFWVPAKIHLRLA